MALCSTGRTLLVAVSLGIAPPAIAQERAIPIDDGRRLDIQVQSDGRLLVRAEHVPVDDVIRAVAAAGRYEVTIVGGISRRPIAASFPVRTVEEILTDVMESEGIGYVLVGGATRRLIMTTAAAGRERPDQVVASKTGPSAPAFDPLPARQPEAKSEPAADPAPPLDPQYVPNPIPRATPPPNTVDALLLEVNGTTPVLLPPGFTPNTGPPIAPDSSPNSPMASASMPTAGETMVRPGLVAASSSPPPVASPTLAPPVAPPPPRVVLIPGAVEVRFPPRQGG